MTVEAKASTPPPLGPQESITKRHMTRDEALDFARRDRTTLSRGGRLCGYAFVVVLAKPGGGGYTVFHTGRHIMPGTIDEDSGWIVDSIWRNGARATEG